jgi:hypothetical protein
MSELGGFQVREARFRREMEKLRGGSQRDLTLFKVCCAPIFSSTFVKPLILWTSCFYVADIKTRITRISNQCFYFITREIVLGKAII